MVETLLCAYTNFIVDCVLSVILKLSHSDADSRCCMSFNFICTFRYANGAFQLRLRFYTGVNQFGPVLCLYEECPMEHEGLLFLPLL